MARSISELSDTAANKLATYCSPTSGYAWPQYDTDLTPGVLASIDFLSPALLSYPIKSKYLESIFASDQPESTQASNPYFRLAESMRRFVAETTDDDAQTFDGLSTDEIQGKNSPHFWTLFLEAIRASGPCRGLTSVAVTKILHRKRPRIVPLVDRRIRMFYGTRKSADLDLFLLIHQDMKSFSGLLDDWRKPFRLPGDRPMSRLRALDIAIWMQWETR